MCLNPQLRKKIWNPLEVNRRRIFPFGLTTGTIGVTHILVVTDFKIPSFTSLCNSSLTAFRNAYATVLALQKIGVTSFSKRN